MGNTVFYNNLNENASQIGWKDIFADYKKKHDRQDLEYALAAGTVLNTASEEYMLQKWRKPWVFYPVMKWGLGLIALLYGLYILLYLLGAPIFPAIEEMTIIIPPLIMPIVIMIFCWELNVPRNISIFELFLIWLIGGFLSLAATAIAYIWIPDGLPACFSAPISEEPAKFIAALIVMLFISRKKKIYGVTGFVVGAAVGAGFAAFESVQYAFRSAQQITDIIQAESGGTIAVVGTSMSGSVVYNQILRLVTAIGGHELYCAPYVAEIARHAKNGKISVESVFNLDFLGAFLVSCLLHGLWDTDILAGFGELGMYIQCAILIVVIWMQAMRILRKCLNQAVQIGAAASGGKALQHGAGAGHTSFVKVDHVERQSAEEHKEIHESKAAVQPHVVSAGIRLICNSGELKGKSWQINDNETLLVGRDESCIIRFSPSAQGVSGRHCSIQHTQFGWTVKDLNSSFGTFVSGCGKVLPGTEIKLKQGDVISLGGDVNKLIIDIV